MRCEKWCEKRGVQRRLIYAEQSRRMNILRSYGRSWHRFLSFVYSDKRKSVKNVICNSLVT